MLEFCLSEFKARRSQFFSVQGLVVIQRETIAERVREIRDESKLLILNVVRF